MFAGLKIIFERWPVVLTGKTNFSSVIILKILILPRMHKKVLLKSINVVIAKSMT